MTATETGSLSAPIDTWAAQLEQLRARYRHVRPPILAALNILVSDPNISVDDAKARAALYGTRITAASIGAARTLMSRMDSPTAPVAPAASAAAPAPKPVRRVRAAEPIDAERMVRRFVAQMQDQSVAEAERLKDAIRRAIAVLEAAVG